MCGKMSRADGLTVRRFAKAGFGAAREAGNRSRGESIWSCEACLQQISQLVFACILKI
jgi:hypothetical protein